MISALLYLQFVSLKNRTLRRIQRLRQPKYLVGGIVGGIYFYFYFIRYLFGVGRPQANLPLAGAPETLTLFEGLGALMLLVMVLLGWVLPKERAALAFSEAEVAFLFPAPISRRGLIHYKLLRSQFAILFTSFFLMLLSNRMGGKVWIHAAGWWVILSTLNLHLLGASFARTMLLDRGITNWQRRAAIFAILGVVTGAVWLWVRRSLPTLDLAQLQGPDQLKEYARQVLTSGPVPWLLLPFRFVVRPYLATSGAEFLRAFLPALGILAVHYVWVIRSNVAFEEASVEVSRKLAEKIAAARAGNLHGARKGPKVRRAPFLLRPTGPAAVALLWKNLISAGQAFTWRLWLTLGILGLSGSLAISQSGRHANFAAVLGLIVGMFLIWSLLLGPQVLRQDFRQDVQVADILKMYPLRGWKIALGELLAPAVILTAIQWCLILVAFGLLAGSPAPGLHLTGWRTGAVGFAAAMLAPPVNLIMLQIPNAAVLLFPAWFQTAREGSQGIEVMGQRILFVLGQFLVFVAAMSPAAICAALVGYAMYLLLFAMPLVIVAASATAAGVLTAEAAVGVVLLGRLFEKFDVAAESAP